MSAKYLLLAIALTTVFLFLGCSDDESAESQDCRDFFLSHLNLEAYDDQEIGCRAFYNLIEFEGNQFVHLDNFCANFGFFTLIDCNGDTICTTQSSSCNIISESENLEILGLVIPFVV